MNDHWQARKEGFANPDQMPDWVKDNPLYEDYWQDGAALKRLTEANKKTVDNVSQEPSRI